MSKSTQISDYLKFSILCQNLLIALEKENSKAIKSLIEEMESNNLKNSLKEKILGKKNCNFGDPINFPLKINTEGTGLSKSLKDRKKTFQYNQI